MKQRKTISRRQFLKGAGGFALGIPFLPSLLPRAAWGQTPTPALRLISMGWPHGYRSQHWLPTAPPTRILEDSSLHHVTELDFATIPGTINPTLQDPRFSALKPKLTLVYGVDQICMRGFHNREGLLCAGMASPPVEEGILASESADVVLSRSSRVYPFEPRLRLLSISNSASASRPTYGSLSYSRSGSTYLPLPVDYSPAAIFNKLFAGVTSVPITDTEKAKRGYIVNRVMEDFQRVMGLPRISNEDRQRLDAHMSLLNDLESRIVNAPAPRACTVPGAPPNDTEFAAWWRTSNYDQSLKLYLDLVAAAMACDLTRIVSIMFDAGLKYPVDFHSNYAHNYDAVSVAKMLEHNQWAAELFAYLCEKLNSQIEDPNTGATILDNSLVLWGNECGATTSTSQHSTKRTQILLAGSLGRRFRTGRMLRFERPLVEPWGDPTVVGPPYNQFLVTILQAFGLQPAEYEPSTEEAPGFGEYGASRTQPLTDMWKYQPYLTTAQRRALLPYLLT